MSFIDTEEAQLGAWVDARIKTALAEAIPDLVAQLTAEEGPLVTNLITGLIKVLDPKFDGIPPSVQSLLNIPGTLETALANLPTQFADLVKTLVPFHLLGEAPKP